ncbi:glutamate--cysteine ligase, chloroplastic-like [Durio zibethinus]|uniref:glutamate--cysteine ligase n=1 Tax=Durio zibethinus TaxID=66656 RepID=A0A6P6BJP5_DURZI|nr:glutamate--cysteine ligase, chloroplastic-like [Durio zibethinus]
MKQIAAALFANSPFTEGKPNGYLSIRSQIWSDTDNDRTSMFPFVFDDSFGLLRKSSPIIVNISIYQILVRNHPFLCLLYVDYALDVPTYFVYRKKNYIDCTGMTSRDFMAGKLPCIPGELPTLNDWENCLTTIFPEVRLKRYLEMRGADGGTWSYVLCQPLVGPTLICCRASTCNYKLYNDFSSISFSTLLLRPFRMCVGLLNDEVSLQNILDMTADWTTEEREILRNKLLLCPLCSAKTAGLSSKICLVGSKDWFKGTISVWVLAACSRRCLRRLIVMMNKKFVAGVTPAEKLLDLYHGKWGESVDPVFE